MFPRTLAHRRLLHSNKKRALATTARCCEKPIMNRHSRIVTQPKDQGASQVHIGKLSTKSMLQLAIFLGYALCYRWNQYRRWLQQGHGRRGQHMVSSLPCSCFNFWQLFAGMRETRKQQLCLPTLQFILNFILKLQQTPSRSGSRSQGISRQVGYHCLSVWHCRGQRWH